MEKNVKLIRKMLIQIEDGRGFVYDGNAVNGHEDNDVQEHLRLLYDDGFAVEVVGTRGFAKCRLTSKGHDFLNSIRNDHGFVKVLKKLFDQRAAVCKAIMAAIVAAIADRFVGGVLVSRLHDAIVFIFQW